MLDINLIVRGVAYSGWTDVAITRSMECLAPTFDVALADVWAQGNAALPIQEGDICVLRVGTENIINGFVEEAEFSYDANGYKIGVKGGARTVDLAECSAAVVGNEWHHQDLTAIATFLCQPFGISVIPDTDVGGPFAKFALLDHSETVFDALDRACRMRGVLMMTDGNGNLLITRAGTIRTASTIRRGFNVVRGSRKGSWKDRFSAYTVKSQMSGDDTLMGPAASSVKAMSLDGNMSRYRPLVVVAETQENAFELKKRADWERNVRAGRSLSLTYVLEGWSNTEGVWEPNVLVRVVDDKFCVDAELIISEVKLSLSSDEGQMTEITVTDPDSFSVKPYKPKPPRGVPFM